MLKRILLLLAATVSCFGQTTPPSPQPTPTTLFNLNASALSLSGNKQTVPGTVIGGTLALTPRLSIREENILVPGADLQAFSGGAQYALPFLSTKVNNSTVLNGNAFQFYVFGTVGIVHLSKNGGDVQHWTEGIGGGMNYDPSGSGKFTVNLFEVSYRRFPGYVNQTAMVSSGLRLGF